MNLHREEAVSLAQQLVTGLRDTAHVDVAIFPALPYLIPVAEALAEGIADHGTPVGLGIQNFYPEPDGAFTGEVSLAMAADCGCAVALVGHSERRHILGETDPLINRKVLAALNQGLDVTLCIGETLQQRETGQTHDINSGQLHLGLAGVSADDLTRVTIAYEPVWAIGTGKTATPDDAQAAHAHIRHMLGVMRGQEIAHQIRIQYGGSVKPGNAADLISQPDIDGFLVGGASLNPDDFIAIVQAAAPR